MRGGLRNANPLAAVRWSVYAKNLPEDCGKRRNRQQARRQPGTTRIASGSAYRGMENFAGSPRIYSQCKRKSANEARPNCTTNSVNGLATWRSCSTRLCATCQNNLGHGTTVAATVPMEQHAETRLLGDDHALMLEGLARLLAGEFEIAVPPAQSTTVRRPARKA